MTDPVTAASTTPDTGDHDLGAAERETPVRSGTTVVFNPVAGGAPDENELRERLGDATLVPTTEDDPGTGQAAEAIERGADLVVACGGDGTVRAVLEAVAQSDATLGLLPFGTGNLLASNLGLPAGFEAMEDMAGRPRRRIDTGEVNGETFAVMAGTGFDAEMMADASSDLKKRIGTSAYVLSAFRHLKDDLVGTTVDIDGDRWFEGRSAMVLVGNFGTISGGIDVFPDASPDDGRLDVMVLSATHLRDWASVAWRLIRRRGLSGVAAERTTGRSITVTTTSPRRWELDGEERAPARRLQFSVQPRSLSVITGEANA